MNTVLLSPKRWDKFVNPDGTLPPQHRRWVEEVSRIANFNGDTIDTINSRLDRIEPQNETINNTHSPYSASEGDRIICEMDIGDVEVQLPDPTSAIMPISIAREGSANTLSVTGAIAKGSPLIIRRDQSCAVLYPDDGGWRIT